MFYEDPDVLVFSIHRYDGGGFYPGGPDGDMDAVGKGEGEGFNVNVPWPRGGAGDADYRVVMEVLLLPIAREFKPDLVLVSAGFDAAGTSPRPSSSCPSALHPQPSMASSRARCQRRRASMVRLLVARVA